MLLVECCAIVSDGGPTWSQHLGNVPLFPGTDRHHPWFVFCPMTSGVSTGTSLLNNFLWPRAHCVRPRGFNYLPKKFINTRLLPLDVNGAWKKSWCRMHDLLWHFRGPNAPCSMGTFSLEVYVSIMERENGIMNLSGKKKYLHIFCECFLLKVGIFVILEATKYPRHPYK